MSENCKLRETRGQVVHCEGDTCVYWRVVEHVVEGPPDADGCAIQYFALLDGGRETADWLLSVKQRLECSDQ